MRNGHRFSSYKYRKVECDSPDVEDDDESIESVSTSYCGSIWNCFNGAHNASRFVVKDAEVQESEEFFNFLSLSEKSRIL